MIFQEANSSVTFINKQSTMRELQSTRPEGNVPQKQNNELSIWTQRSFP